jgi:hypothetical protein
MASGFPTSKLHAKQARVNAMLVYDIVFGGLAIIVTRVTLDPWLCVAGFRRVCHYRYELFKVQAV